MSEKITFKVTEKEEYTVLEFELAEPLTPSDLITLKPPEINLKKGVIISGRGPIWLYVFLAHHYHPSSFIAVFDPRLGAIIVETHTPKYKVSDIIPL